jgi:hypothetical protein
VTFLAARLGEHLGECPVAIVPKHQAHRQDRLPSRTYREQDPLSDRVPVSGGCGTFGFVQVTDPSVWNSTMDNPAELRRRASRYRDIARTATGAATIKALHELADRFEALATEAQARRDVAHKDQC